MASLGLSNVTVADIEEAGRHFTVATVQNRYNLTDGSSEDVLDHCTAPRHRVHPVGADLGRRARRAGRTGARGRHPSGRDPRPGRPGLAAAPLTGHAADPGTGSIAHLEENLAAAELELDDATYAEITAAR